MLTVPGGAVVSLADVTVTNGSSAQRAYLSRKRGELV